MMTVSSHSDSGGFSHNSVDHRVGARFTFGPEEGITPCEMESNIRMYVRENDNGEVSPAVLWDSIN